MDTNTLATIALLGGFFLLLLLRIPVTFSLLIATLTAALIKGTAFTVMVRMMIDGVDNFTLLAIPFFILMGEIMSAGGISDKLIDLANLIIGRFRGGFAYVNCLASMMFGGISGSAVADVSSLGTVEIPMMEKQGYEREFAVGLTVTTSCQGVLVPPSHNMVIYALSAGTGVTVAGMFMGGIIPGILLGLSLMVYCFIKGIINPKSMPVGDKVGANDPVRWVRMVGSNVSNIPQKKFGVTYKEDSWLILHLPFGAFEIGKCLKTIIQAIFPLFTFVIILGGVSAGIFTATESAAIAAVYTFLLTYVVFRSAKLKDFPHVLKNCLKTLCVVMTLLACAKAFAYMMTLLRIPAQITTALLSVSNNKYVLLLIINLLLILLGCFMDMAPLIMIMTPILLPVVTSPVIGMNPIHFGIMLIFNLAVGLCTPPVGTALFVGCAIGKTSLEKTAVKTFPMFAVMFIGLMLVTYIPFFSMWIPTILGLVG